MAQTLVQRLMELGTPFVPANELVKQINSRTYNVTRLINAGWVDELSRYLATSLAAGTFKATKAVEYSMVPAVAALIAGVAGDDETPVPTFDPYAAGVNTFGWNPQDPATLFQDIARTVPVTAAGQIVAAIADKTGNGHHASFVTSTAISGFYDLVGAVVFNGTDSQLRANTLAALMSGAALPPFTIMWAEFDPDSAGATQTRWAFGSANSAPRFQVRGDASGVLSAVTQPTAGSAQTHSFNSGAEGVSQRWTLDFNGTTLVVYRNGSEIYRAVVTQGAFSFDRFALGAQYRGSAADFGEFKLGEMFGRIGSQYSAADLAAAHAYMAARFPASSGGGLTPAGNVSLHIIAGQSNAEGRGTAADAPVVPALGAFYLTGSTFTQLNDPVGGADTGSAWPAFAIQWKSSKPGNSPIFRETAQGGTSVLDAEAPNWSATGTLAPASRVALNAAVANINATPGCTLTGSYIHWAEGESAARIIASGVATVPQYKAALKAKFEADKAQCPTLAAIFIYELGKRKDGATEDVYAAIRQVQHEMAAELPYVFVVYEGAKTFPDRTFVKDGVTLSYMKDSVHYKQPGYNEMGTMGAIAAVTHA